MPGESHILEAIDVAYAYDGEPVVRNVSLRIGAGEAVALAGPNGSGKTTLLRLLCGDLSPSTGSIVFGLKNLQELSPTDRARRIAVVPQRIDPTLAFRVRDLVGMGRAPHAGWFGTLSAADHLAVQSALNLTETLSLAPRLFSELSGGEQQRVALAMALAQETEFLLLDEPTVHLDLHHQYEILELLRTFQRQRGIGVLAVMHDLNLASLYFGRLAVLDDGRLVGTGEPSALLDDPNILGVFRAPLAMVKHPDTGTVQVLIRPSE
ncbi:MAG: ABC transporter ATP-binding protein [Chloroflexota bacterium]